jgi:hypothetical protein
MDSLESELEKVTLHAGKPPPDAGPSRTLMSKFHSHHRIIVRLWFLVRSMSSVIITVLF